MPRKRTSKKSRTKKGRKIRTKYNKKMDGGRKKKTKRRRRGHKKAGNPFKTLGRTVVSLYGAVPPDFKTKKLYNTVLADTKSIKPTMNTLNERYKTGTMNPFYREKK